MTLTPFTRSHSSGAVSWIGLGKAIPAFASPMPEPAPVMTATLAIMTAPKRRPARIQFPEPAPEPERPFFNPVGALWRLFFAIDYRPPTNFYDRRRRRCRASFFFLLGDAATLAVQMALRR